MIAALLLVCSLSIGVAQAQPNFTFSYVESGTDVIITMTTLTTGDEWVSVGFSDSGEMANADVIVCEKGSNTRCTDRLCTGHSECGIDAVQNISTTTTVANGLTTFTVKRPMQTSDSQDYVIKAGTAPKMIWGYGTGAASNKHSKYGNFTPSLSTSGGSTSGGSTSGGSTSNSALSAVASLKGSIFVSALLALIVLA